MIKKYVNNLTPIFILFFIGSNSIVLKGMTVKELRQKYEKLATSHPISKQNQPHEVLDLIAKRKSDKLAKEKEHNQKEFNKAQEEVDMLTGPESTFSKIKQAQALNHLRVNELTRKAKLDPSHNKELNIAKYRKNKLSDLEKEEKSVVSEANKMLKARSDVIAGKGTAALEKLLQQEKIRLDEEWITLKNEELVEQRKRDAQDLLNKERAASNIIDENNEIPEVETPVKSNPFEGF
ncbi:MAG: hypothetical protein P4L22_03660 [Candidatus Babeliales bacterium]|nr:hypothetical protein [Candidatus Babeliales bacterium]